MLAARPSLRVRDYLIEEYTRTVCPQCLESGPRTAAAETFVDGLLVSRDQRLWMRRFCPEHGETESLYEEDLEVWRARRGWSTPTSAVVPDRADNRGGFPEGYRHGLPPSHGQHTCILVLNVTERCNYACSTCYASARPPGEPVPAVERPTQSQMVHTVRTVLEREDGKLGVVMLSGGEPTLRRDLPALIEDLARENITRIMLNTNGRRIVRDDKFLDLLHRYRDRLEVYLQFDGLRSATYECLRGEDVAREKRQAVKRLQDAGVFTTLVMTVRRGLNEDEVGDVLLFALEVPHCSGLAIQPEFGSGRGLPFDPRDRVTPTGVLRRLEGQTQGLVTWRDFIPLPCSHQDCCDISYLIRGGDDRWRSLPSMLGRDELKRWIHLIANTITFEDLRDPVKVMLRSGALQRVFSEQQKVSASDLTLDILQLCDCVPGLNAVLGEFWKRVRRRKNPAQGAAERSFRITTKMFMDAHTFHEARIRQCCVHTGTYESDPRRYSFCWRWLFDDAGDFPEGPA